MKYLPIDSFIGKPETALVDYLDKLHGEPRYYIPVSSYENRTSYTGFPSGRSFMAVWNDSRIITDIFWY